MKDRTNALTYKKISKKYSEIDVGLDLKKVPIHVLQAKFREQSTKERF